MKIKILNAYAGIGGNRKLWGDDHEITAVEIDPGIAAIYKHFFPNDNVIVGDAHDYILHHHEEYDFIWSSPPCPTHSRHNYVLYAKGYRRYPLMTLYEEILYLKQFYKGVYCIENVIPYYKPLVEPQKSGRHFYWANFNIPYLKPRLHASHIYGQSTPDKRRKAIAYLGFDIPKHLSKGFQTEKLLRNCVDPAIGKAILDEALNNIII